MTLATPFFSRSRLAVSSCFGDVAPGGARLRSAVAATFAASSIDNYKSPRTFSRAIVSGNMR